MLRVEQTVIQPQGYETIAVGGVLLDTDLPPDCLGLVVGTAGVLNVTMRNGHQINSLPFQEGLTPGLFVKIHTGGTAENIVAVGTFPT